MIKLRSFCLLSIFSSLILSLGGCKLALFNPKGLIAADEAHLLTIAVLLMLIIVIPVIALTLLFAWRYRASNTKAKYAPEWSHSTALEIVCWSIPCIIITVLATITWITSHQLDPYRPLPGNKKPLTIQAIALNWKWLFIYPEQNIATINYVQLPAHTPIRFLITADAPMNSFQIQQLAGQIYAMAGMQTKLNLIADKKGQFRGLSTNFSGDGFSDMRFAVKVTSKEKFNQWVNTIQKTTDKLTMTDYQRLAKPSQNNSVEYFSLADKDLFNTVMMEYMMPMSNMKGMPNMQAQKEKGTEMPEMQSMKNIQETSESVNDISKTKAQGSDSRSTFTDSSLKVN